MEGDAFSEDVSEPGPEVSDEPESSGCIDESECAEGETCDLSAEVPACVPLSTSADVSDEGDEGSEEGEDAGPEANAEEEAANGDDGGEASETTPPAEDEGGCQGGQPPLMPITVLTALALALMPRWRTSL